jgi:8-oxo-dGTP pyrophosphatase MutT (NUDIX family)
MPDPQAAVAIVHAQGEQESVLLIRRSERADDPWSGHWSFPGGRRDPDDSDLLHTALRELSEECGICLGREHLERSLDPANARRRTGPFLMVAPFVLRVDRELPVKLDEREAAGSVWMPMRVLRDPERHCLRAIPGVPPQMIFPAIELDGMPLWGFTYRLITEWLQLCPPHDSRGFATASTILDFLLARGLALEHGWTERNGVRTAAVRGAIPVDSVLKQLAARNGRVPAVNVVEVRPEAIRIAGLDFEEYLIEAR